MSTESQTMCKTVFCVSENFWNQHGQDMLFSKMAFQRHLAMIIGDEYEQGQVVIVLPHSVTIAQRHFVHKFSKKDEIKSISSNFSKKRVMKIILEEKYVKQIL